MEPVVDRVVALLEPLSSEVRDAALVSSLGAVAHAALAERVPALGALESVAPPAPCPLPGRLRIAAWNAERLKHQDASAALLDRAGADVALLSEVDYGMARSGNRRNAAEIAARRGAGYVYGVEFVELGLGDARETLWHAGERNGAGFHGNAILSRFRLAEPFLVRLDAGGVWFGGEGGQRRLGGRMALAARLADAPTPVWVVVVHLESRSTPALRAAQISRLLAVLAERIGDAACLIGGDFNTSALPRGEGLPEAVLRDPAGLEPLFDDMRGAGFRWAAANSGDVTSRTRPDGAPLPPFTRIDWLFVRGVAASDPMTLPAIDCDGAAISDHDLVAVTIDLAGIA